ncbi:MAG: RsbT co-antagonist protein RsbRA [Bacillota bacterium]|uniref:RsbT co-antagonist protein RsbRA n=1 Tax=Virgibacillus salarius TaxID=447199 RepID=A0A941IBB9_9BACI|nr:MULTISPECIES: RsbT co-antagonist protein RsbRA [Bacillaceae]NAZ08955.1 STAS domain-containing protein [Agaribacter marinus]MBR7796247.1 RsbT co-antagonist protein RsbRA [Virgibacillus salarius]MCC2251644.1 RsbT co-antagonist protein RsbRA [Virgibacillus sp. AGTR]MDY7045156.1 RsbT co-antagonist protein RsbRA [Virgibacillus sp. M23]QRZ19677.1 RsbT co-antagonist protein RsbRA [Virgibacillus sp. AGTR]
MDEKFKKIAIENSDSIVQMWMEEINSLKDGNYTSSISDELFESTNREFVNVIFTSIKNAGPPKAVESFSEKIINLGWPLSYITDGLQVFRRVTVDYILSQSEQVDSAFISNVLKSVDAWVEPLIRQLVNEYSGSWENIVSLQRVALQELSAPLIPVMDSITIMPLIGTIDTERAKLIMENLLDGVIKHNSEVVLIDITGVPVVDTMVAHHIIQAAEAVRLIGSTCILVGIRPEIAQTIVNLGIDLGKFPTKSSLKKGFRSALEITNRKIVDLETKEESIEELIQSLKGE